MTSPFSAARPPPEMRAAYLARKLRKCHAAVASALIESSEDSIDGRSGARTVALKDLPGATLYEKTLTPKQA